MTTPTETHEVSCHNLWKIFGPHPEQVKKRLSAEKSRAEILEETGHVVAVKDVSFGVRKGETFVVMGLSGSGKSTLVRCMSRLIEPTAGQVKFDGERIDGLSPHKIVRKGISPVPEARRVFARLTVKENLEMGAFIRKDDYSQRLEEVFDLFPILKGRRKQKAGLLSGGQRQMVAMGRALMLDPQVLLLDEPSAGLSPILVSSIFENPRAWWSSGDVQTARKRYIDHFAVSNDDWLGAWQNGLALLVGSGNRTRQ